MNLLIVGTPEDVTGFALAGVEGVVCTNREEAGQAIANAGADTLVLVSAEYAVPRRSSAFLGAPRRGSFPPRNSEELTANVVALPARM